MNQIHKYRAVPSRFGKVLLVWRLAGRTVRVVRVVLPHEPRPPARILKEEFPGAEAGSHPAMMRLGKRLEAFLAGTAVTFSLDLVDLDVCSAFQRRVLPAEHRVPRGRVTTYGRLARRVGAPGAARATGNALSRNQFPLIIPCHRCVRENGQLGGFRGGLDMKRALLEMEGIVFDRRGRVPRNLFW
jgi:methylated-DNA-[protein]-cysteine S-methyltransferase